MKNVHQTKSATKGLVVIYALNMQLSICAACKLKPRGLRLRSVQCHPFVLLFHPSTIRLFVKVEFVGLSCPLDLAGVCLL